MQDKSWRLGVKSSLPVVLGYLPIGLAFGVLASQSGLKTGEVFLMSLLVYAGSSQFIAAGLLAAGASFWTIIVTTLLVNSRHILMSASLTPFVKKYSAPLLAGISFGITDETYAVAISTLSGGEQKPGFFLGLNLTAHLCWVISTVLGAMAGNLIPEPEAFGLHFALPAMFIGLLLLQMKRKLSIVIALSAAALSLFFKLYIPGNWYVILASVLAATIGVIVEQWTEKSLSSSSA